MESRLHLPKLTVERFRGIQSLKLPHLGRVVLLAGQNGIGKTTILEAIRLYASRGDLGTLMDLIEIREEFVPANDEEGGTSLFPDFKSLFYNHEPREREPTSQEICIHSSQESDRLSLQLIDANDVPSSVDLFSEDITSNFLRVSFGERNHFYQVNLMNVNDRIRRRPFPPRVRTPGDAEVWPAPIRLESLGPGLLDTSDVVRLWDSIALTETEDFVTETLRLVVGNELTRLAVVGDPSKRYRTRGRRVVAKLASSSNPIPLKRLGDGANRLLGIALALANCRNGILLIDEVENGIHYSIQTALWRMIFAAAEAGNVQVVAATHSWDCIAGFAAAATKSPADGHLFRLERFKDEIVAVYYPEKHLDIAARQRIEVR